MFVASTTGSDSVREYYERCSHDLSVAAHPKAVARGPANRGDAESGFGVRQRISYKQRFCLLAARHEAFFPCRSISRWFLFPKNVWGEHLEDEEEDVCTRLQNKRKQDIGCFLFRLLARVCVFACLWLRLGLCLHGAASVSLSAGCVPPFFPPPLYRDCGRYIRSFFVSEKNLPLFPTYLLYVHLIAETCGSLFRNFKIILKFDELKLL